jgi:hypothetical protein
MIFKGDALRRATQKMIPTLQLELIMTNVHALKLPLALLSTLSTVMVRDSFVSQIWVGYLRWWCNTPWSPVSALLCSIGSGSTFTPCFYRVPQFVAYLSELLFSFTTTSSTALEMNYYAPPTRSSPGLWVGDRPWLRVCEK